MLKIQSVLSVQVNSRDYQFICSPDSPLKEALEANNQINAFLLGRIQQAENIQSDASQPSEPIDQQPKSE